MKNKEIEIYIDKRKKILVSDTNITDNEEESRIYLMTIIKNIETYGFTFSEKLINQLSMKNKDYLISLYEELIPVLKDMIGYGDNMIPMYPNFPQQVMEASEVELYLNAIIHYMSLGTILPEYELKRRFPLIENPKLSVIDLGDEEDFYSIFKNLLLSKASLSQSDLEVVNWFIKNSPKEKLINLIPDTIPTKEILSYVTSLLREEKGFEKKLFSMYKTATDVLRLVVCMNAIEGDMALEGVVTFKSFRRKDRVFLLTLLENCKNLEEDMLRNKQTWKNLGKTLHVGEYKGFKKVNSAFYKLRNNIKIDTFNSKIERAFESKDKKEIINILSKRPGEFARHLDRAIRTMTSDDKEEQIALRLDIVSAFKDVSKKVATPILLQLVTYFENRTEDKNSDLRVFFPKSNVSKSYAKENDLLPLEKIVCDKLIDVCSRTLRQIYGEKDSIGKVYIDKGLEKFVVPMSQRTSSKSLLNVARGSRFTMKDQTKYLRAFIYWNDMGNRIDVDLGAFFCNENFEKIQIINFAHPKNDSLNTYHSGDITSAHKGASEYLDIDIERSKKCGVRYVVISVNSFSGQAFCNMPVCFAGFMERENVNSGEIFEPKTVKNKSDLTTKNVNNIPIIIDLETNEVIWADLGYDSCSELQNTIHDNTNSLANALKSIVYMKKPNMYYLAKLHTLARGSEFVDDIEEADTVFVVDKDVLLEKQHSQDETVINNKEEFEDIEDVEKKEQVIITPYDTDIIISEYL